MSDRTASLFINPDFVLSLNFGFHLNGFARVVEGGDDAADFEASHSLVKQLVVLVAQIGSFHLSHHNGRPLLESVELEDSGAHVDDDLLQLCAKADLLDVFGLGRRVDCALNFNVCCRVGRQQLDRVVSKLGEDSIRPVLPSMLRVDEALARADDIGLRLVHQENNVLELGHLNLMRFTDHELQVRHQLNVLDFEWNP